MRQSVIDALRYEHAELPSTRLARLRSVGATTFLSGKLWADQAIRRQPVTDSRAIGRMVRSIGELKGVAMKMGQIFSYIDTAIPEEVRAGLAALQTHAPQAAFETIQGVILRELRAQAHPLLDSMERQPVAVASVGQVHRATLADGTKVAVKVQYPKIDKAIDSDFGPAALGARLAGYFYPHSKIKSLVRQARARFAEECDYEYEARRQTQFADLYTGHPTIIVPAVHPRYCSRRVLTTTWVEGEHLDAFLARRPDQRERDQMGEALFELYVGTLFKYGLYNCDPHPGNYLFCRDGRLVALDFGCTQEFGPSFVVQIAALTLAAHAGDLDRLHRTLVGLGIIRYNHFYDRSAALRLLRTLYGPMVQDEVLELESDSGVRIREAIKSNEELLKIPLPGELLFLLRLRIGLTSVLARLGTRANWYQRVRGYLDPRAADGKTTWESTRYDVILKDAGDNAIQVVRAIRDATGMGIKEAKELVELAPGIVARQQWRKDAEVLLRKLEVSGALVDVMPSSDKSEAAIDSEAEKKAKKGRRRAGRARN
jgi:predicted unusual protein kinase regulating ubiquinone biosynthesis (AarF/ABC1/UbiB family)